MGIDAAIYFMADEKFDGVEDACFEHDVYPILDTCYTSVPSWCAKATHYINLNGRVFRDGYLRGDWPHHSAVLLLLLGCPHIKRVWYGGDDGKGTRVTPAFITKQNTLWIENKRDSYSY